MNTIGIIGFGNMGEAFAAGLATASSVSHVYIYDTDSSRMTIVEKSDTYRAAQTVPALFHDCDIIIVAVKPQYIATVADRLPPECHNSNIISIAAGVSIATLQNFFQTSSVIRFMPNIAAKTGSAVVAMSAAESTSSEFKASALLLAETIGKPIQLPEKLMAAFTGLSGSGIAYVFEFLHALALGGTKAGISYQESLTIAMQTLKGALDLLESSGEHPVSWLSKVTSAGGTTIEGITELEKNGFVYSVIQAVNAAAQRASDFEA